MLTSFHQALLYWTPSPKPHIHDPRRSAQHCFTWNVLVCHFMPFVWNIFNLFLNVNDLILIIGILIVKTCFVEELKIRGTDDITRTVLMTDSQSNSLQMSKITSCSTFLFIQISRCNVNLLWEFFYNQNECFGNLDVQSWTVNKCICEKKKKVVFIIFHQKWTTLNSETTLLFWWCHQALLF